MKTFEIIATLEKYKYEILVVIGLIGSSFIGEADPFNTLSGLIMLFGMFGMLAKTVSPTVSVVTLDVEQIAEIIEMIERKTNE